MLALCNLIKSLLCISSQSALTLGEGNEYKILNLNLTNATFLFNDLLNNLLLLNYLRFAVTEFVDLSIQSIDLSLIAKLFNCKVVGAVRSHELVVYTKIQLEVTVVDIILHARSNGSAQSIGPSCKTIVQRGLQIDLPSFILTKIKSKVKSHFRSQRVGLIVNAIDMSPAKTIQTYYLKITRLALITTEEVTQVKGTQ